MNSEAFTERLIRTLQANPCSSEPGAALFRQAGSDYLRRVGRLSIDLSRGLVWVQPPNGPLEAALWIAPFDQQLTPPGAV